ncbi:hypothetical protein [Sulfoacidibacillus thermotolerans]|uniref:Uncharacterized protein n=1 Tax=Sulfoacidibacillus thermotolerans TaxID=1765684 RepID=A0A2U3CZ06_SULT2|nr:hypothetical protein [Sulfoacidibacillus thermotolerans]PWI54262.1 hypothetical protein BM613_13840 [Sulfoacidibacillus thermotolerans]
MSRMVIRKHSLEKSQALERFIPVIHGKIRILRKYDYWFVETYKEDLFAVGVTAFYEALGERDEQGIKSHIRRSMDRFRNDEDRQVELAERLMGRMIVLAADAERVRNALNELKENGDTNALDVAHMIMEGIADRKIPELLGITRMAYVQARLRIEKALVADKCFCGC